MRLFIRDGDPRGSVNDRRTSGSRRRFLQALAAGSARLLAGGFFGFAGTRRIRAAPAGPVLAAPPIQFSNVTQQAGIHFVHYKGNQGMSTVLEETGPGVGVADYDGDGYPDIYFVNGRERYGRGVRTRNALYHNNGDGTFTDVTERAGVPGTAYGLGCTWGDYDNDGNPDLYVTQYGKNILYHNNGDGTFTDVTDKAGASGLENGAVFHTGATFFDYDRDGRLDLYAGGYCHFGPASQRYCNIGVGVFSGCRPAIYGGTADALYHNNGDGTFTEVSRQAGVYNPNGLNLSVQSADYDNDGWPDLAVANDGIRCFLYHNQHNGTFVETGLESGMAVASDGYPMSAMCISFGDYDRDGNLDLYVSDYQDVPDHLFHNLGNGMFDEASMVAGIAQVTADVLSWGGGFFDYDNDGWLDIFIANGHVAPNISQVSPGISYRQLNMLFHNQHDGTFVEVSARSGAGFATPYSGRGVAFADFDNDGRIEVVVANNGSEPLLLHSDGSTSNRFVNLKLVGTRSNRDAMGSRVKLAAVNGSQIGEVMGGGSYLSQSDLRLHFGLGQSSEIAQIEVAWPSGLLQTFQNVAANRFYLIEEGKSRLGLQKHTPRQARA